METLTACTLDCPDACSLLVAKAEDGRIRIRGNPHHPITRGFTCAKIRGFGRRLRSPNRILTPLLRVDGGWHPVSWEEALDLCARKIQKYRAEPASILHILGGADKGVLRLATSLFFARLGASRTGGCLCDEAGIAASIEDFGSLDHNDIRDLANARWIVNWGKDLLRSSIHVGALVKKARRRGARVLTISPGGDGNKDFSDALIRIRPGTDRFLAAAAVRRLMVQGRIGKEVLGRVRNWEAFRDAVLCYSEEDLLRACGVSGKDLYVLLDYYGRPGPVATLIGLGLQRHRFGGETVRFINALAVLAGHVGRSGAGVYYNISSLRNLNTRWAEDPLDEERRVFLFPTLGRDILEAKDPPVRMIWVNGTNVVNQSMDSRTIARALERTEFVVVVDAFLTDTAERADLVLPCRLMLEKEDVIGSWLHDFVHYVRPVAEAPEGTRSDTWILRELGRRLDPLVEIPSDEDCLRMTLESSYLDVSLEELRQEGFVRARRPWIAFEGMAFHHPDGKFWLTTELHPEPPAPQGFPFRFLTAIRRDALHSQILPEDHPETPTAWVAAGHPVLQELDLSRDVFLISPLGRLKVRLEPLEGLHPDVVLYRRDDWMKLGGGPNQLIAAGLTDMGECAPFYQQYVRIESG